MEHKKAMPPAAKSPTMYDPMIIPRVKQYLEENVHQTYVDVGVMARLLQERYREYSRRKAAPFRQLVEQAYKTVLHSYGLDSNPSSDENDEISSDLEMMEERPDLMNNMMTNMYMDKQGTRTGPSPNDNELIDISSDESDSEAGNGKKSTKPKSGGPAVSLPPVSIKKVTVPSPPANVFSGGPTKEATNASTVKPGNKNLEAMAIGAVQASFSPLAKRRKINDEPSSQDGLPELKSKPVETVKLTKPEVKQNRPPAIENGTTAVNGGTSSAQPKGGLKKTKKEFTYRMSNLMFKDVGGMDKILKELCELLLHIKHPEVNRFIGLPPPRGFLLHGPPGCGKTLLAQAIAGQLDVALIQVAATELVAGVSGESEERIRELFEQAASLAPCVLFIDEIDAISSNRQNAQKDMERRIVAQLLSSLDGLSKFCNGDQVLIIGATNRPDALDPALRRVGRFDQEISLGIPDRAARESILKVLCHYLILERPFNFDAIAALTPGYVGADLLALATRAASLAVKRAFTAKERKLIRDLRPIATVDLVDDVLTIAPQDISDVIESAIDVDVDDKEKPDVFENKELSKKSEAAVNGDVEMAEHVEDTDKPLSETEKSKSDEKEVAVEDTDKALNAEETPKPAIDVVEKEESKEIKAPTDKEAEKNTESIDLSADMEMKSLDEATPQLDTDEAKETVEDKTSKIDDETTPKIIEVISPSLASETSPKVVEEETAKIDEETTLKSVKESTPKVIEEATAIVDEVNNPKIVEETNPKLDEDIIHKNDEELKSKPDSESTVCSIEESSSTPIEKATPPSDSQPKVTITEVVDLSDDETLDDAISQLPLNDMLRWLSDHESMFTNEDLHCLCITMNDFTDAIKLVQPSAKREGFITVPDVTWDDIGSMRDIREELQLAVLAPVKYPQKLLSLGLNSPSGVLLCGPPGCGKTLLAKAVANEAGINFISVKGPELLNMYVGESERAVRQCFQRARNSAPCVIFFDEFDSLCPTRSGSSENTSSSRVVNQLLTEMDGIEDRKGVFLMAATNRPDIVDPAVLRPGRLDKIIYVGLPGVKDRKEILEALTKKKPKLATNVDIEELATLTENYTGADLAGLVRQASLHALKESIAGSMSTSAGSISSSRNADHALNVNRENFLNALTHIRPSVSEEDKRHYAKLQKKYMVTASTPQ